MIFSPQDIERLANMPMAYHTTRFSVQVAGIAGDLDCWVFAPPPQALHVAPLVVELYSGGLFGKSYWHLVPNPMDGSYSFAQYLCEHYRAIVVACDHLGTGSHRPENGFALSLDVLAGARAQVAQGIRTRLAQGTLLPDYPALPQIRLAAIAHSVGALILHRVQARFQPYELVAFLGWTHGEAHYGTVDREVVGQALMPNPQGYVELSSPACQALRPFFYLPDVPAQVIRAAEQQAPVLPAGILAAMFQPGADQADAAQITVPVFLGYSEQDVSCDPARDAACYPQSPDVRLYQLGGAAHCHNAAPTRQMLWRELGWWLQQRPAMPSKRSA
jgi:pimeloyl-ACP methyl ester carboxylesterase